MAIHWSQEEVVAPVTVLAMATAVIPELEVSLWNLILKKKNATF